MEPHLLLHWIGLQSATTSIISESQLTTHSQMEWWRQPIKLSETAWLKYVLEILRSSMSTHHMYFGLTASPSRSQLG